MQKYSGAGNSFMIIDNRENEISERKKFVLDVMNGQDDQTDGVIFLEKSDIADFKMNYFNRDGTGDALCGNGLRCTARYVSDNGISDNIDLTIEAVSNIYKARFENDGTISVEFPPPARVKLNFKLKVHFQEWWEMLNCSYVDVGSPHIVVFTDEIEKPQVSAIEEVRVNEWGRNIRMHKDLMPEGANVNFVKIDDKDKAILSVRSYERGVEGETLACGTGAISSAIVFYAVRSQVNPVYINTRSGQILRVRLDIEERKIRRIFLSGNAERVK